MDVRRAGISAAGCRALLAGLVALCALSPCAAQDPDGVTASPGSPPVAGAPANQNPPGQEAPGEKAPGQAVGPGGLAPGKFPPPPLGFHRGNPPLSSTAPGQIGWYINLGSLAFVLILFGIWLKSARWVDEDSRVLKIRNDMWNTIMLVSGVLGFLIGISAPSAVIAMLIVAVAYVTPFSIYVVERNSRVPESGKVFTPQHIRSVVLRSLARVGIRIGGAEALEKAIGPPITFIGKSTTGRGEDTNTSRQVESSRGYLAAKELVYDAIMRRATDIHIEPGEEETVVRIRIDGVMYPTEPFDRGVGDAVVNIFKVLSAMDITEKRRPQDGSFRADLENRQVDFRVATAGTRFGEKLSMRILDQANSVSTLAGLGLREQIRQQVLEQINQPHGLILVCGPTGAGKSTTLYAAINEIDHDSHNIITVEDPIEYKMEGVNQIEINTKAGNTFASSLRSILRQDPDVVMIGEIRDGETATIACQAANTGHVVFSTVHANDTLTALYRVLELGVEPFMIANSVSAIIGQRLCRRLCNECKEAYTPKPELLKQAGLPAQKIDKFYRPPKSQNPPCPKCHGLGYRGRTGVFEVLIITDRMRDMIRDKAALSALKAEARKNGMLTMKEEGLRLVVKGVTAIDELVRVVK